MIYRDDPDTIVDALLGVNTATGAVLSVEGTDGDTTDALSFRTGARSDAASSSPASSGVDIHRQTGSSGSDTGNWATGDPVSSLGGDDYGREFYGYFSDGGGTLAEYDQYAERRSVRGTHMPAPAYGRPGDGVPMGPICMPRPHQGSCTR